MLRIMSISELMTGRWPVLSVKCITMPSWVFTGNHPGNIHLERGEGNLEKPKHYYSFPYFVNQQRPDRGLHRSSGSVQTAMIEDEIIRTAKTEDLPDILSLYELLGPQRGSPVL